MKITCERMLELRKEKQLTQKEISNYLKIGQSTYSRYEQGILEINAEILIALCILYKVSSDYLCGLTDNFYKDILIQNIFFIYSLN